jgi:hypothetical protein
MRASPALVVLVVSAVLAAGCGTVRDNATELPQQAGSVTDQAQFCFSVARALQGVEAENVSRDVIDAAEEVLAQAPDDLRDHARVISTALTDAAEGLRQLRGHQDLDHAVDRLRDGARTMCEPRR